ncbi:MAG: hypothetical protein MH472_08510 [Bacteroidia bacterium]|nr:hypothetical protein [Bacteroidia bacterium]
MQAKIKSLKFILLFFPLIIFMGFAPMKHPFYLSVTELTVQSKQGLVQASCKIFTDDLQLALFQMHGKSVNLEIKSKQNDSLLSVFAQRSLEVYTGKNQVKMGYLGYEIEEEAVWFYLEGSAKNISNEIKVINQFLCKSIPTQSNVIHCTYNQTRKSYKLNCPEREFVFKF